MGPSGGDQVMRAGPLLRRSQSSLAPPPPCEYAVKWWWSLSQEGGSVGAVICEKSMSVVYEAASCTALVRAAGTD